MKGSRGRGFQGPSEMLKSLIKIKWALFEPEIASNVFLEKHLNP